MKFFDCFMYNNEDLILDVRLNSLDKYIDKFVIVEAKQNHQGKKKDSYNFEINNFKKFKDKIKYLKIENFPDQYSSWQRENFQRNFITKGLLDANDDDFVIISDIDEIPNLEYLDKLVKSNKRYTAFKQKMIYYKFNLLNLTEADWHGSRMCKFKDLKSPQWLRDQKVKKYPFYRLDKIKWQIVDNGGWHFSMIMTPTEISEKIKSFAHTEFNTPEFTNVENIEKKIKLKEDLFGRKFEFQKILDKNDLPKYITENEKKFSQFLM